MNYAVGCAFNFNDLFMNFPTEKLHLTGNECLEINHDSHKKSLCKKVFREMMKIVIEDIIDNNNTFVLPTGSKKCDLHVTRYDGDAFKKARQNGKFKEVDILKSMFTGNQLTFNMYSNNRTRIKPIYLNKYFKNKLTDNTNNGKQYC